MLSFGNSVNAHSCHHGRKERWGLKGQQWHSVTGTNTARDLTSTSLLFKNM